jgi:thymidine phosphorylase
VLQLGGGRKATTDVIDPAAGVDRLVQAGDAVEKGQPLMRLLAKDASQAESLVASAIAAVRITSEAVPERKLILETVRLV